MADRYPHLANTGNIRDTTAEAAASLVGMPNVGGRLSRDNSFGKPNHKVGDKARTYSEDHNTQNQLHDESKGLSTSKNQSTRLVFKVPNESNSHEIFLLLKCRIYLPCRFHEAVRM